MHPPIVATLLLVPPSLSVFLTMCNVTINKTVVETICQMGLFDKYPVVAN